MSDFNLDVWNGSIVGVLGTSGSGKTTALRLLAGFDKPDSGFIEMRNNIIASDDTFLPPEERTVGMVFQDYALFPHLNINLRDIQNMKTILVIGSDLRKETPLILSLIHISEPTRPY